MPSTPRAGASRDPSPAAPPDATPRPGRRPRAAPARQGRLALLGWAAAAGLAVLPAPAVAQYQWRDAEGRMVFSDQPPPTSVPPSRILRADPMPPPPAPAPATSRRPAESAADRQIEARRKAVEAADAAKKREAEAEQAARLAKACSAAMADQRVLDSGMRIARLNADGEREFLSDEDRAQRAAATQRALKDFCKGG